MSQPRSVARPVLSGPTLAYRPGADGSSIPPPCRVAAQCGGTGSQFHSEIETLLRSRLRLVCVLLLAPTVFFFIKNLIDLDLTIPEACVNCMLHAVVTATLAGLTGLVWLRPCLHLGKLRAVELTLFGMMTIFFAWLQYQA